jgi:hypothetical protein
MYFFKPRAKNEQYLEMLYLNDHCFKKNFDLHFHILGYNFTTFLILDGPERKSKVSPFEEKYSTSGQAMH